MLIGWWPGDGAGPGPVRSHSSGGGHLHALVRGDSQSALARPPSVGLTSGVSGGGDSWGGHGRTGTVVSVMLALLYGLSADEAMFRCQFVHDLRRIPIVVGSPQTQPQRDQVSRLAAC